MVSDQELLGILAPNLAGAAVLLPMRSKTEVIKATAHLRDILPPGIPGSRVYGIVDADEEVPGPVDGLDGVYRWPFCMIENVLLQPTAIFELLEEFADSTGLRTEAEVKSALENVAHELRGEEVEIRVRRRIGFDWW